MAMQPGASAVERVPVEVWLEIFKQVPKSTDLHSLSVASRKCCSITTRALHRDLVWDKERQAAQDLDVWQTDAGMASRVRSLVLSIGGVPANNTPAQNEFILGNYVWPSALKGLTPAAQQALLAPNKQVLSRSEQVQAVLWARVETFTNLSSLVLKDMTIRNGHFRLIHNLAQLRSLSLIGCNVDHGAADGFNNQALPITSLTMIGVRRERGATVHAHAWHNPAFFAPVQPIPLPQLQLALAQANLPIAQILLNQGNPPPVAPDSFAQALSLAAAPTLRTLKVDSSTDVFRHVFDAPGAEDRGWVAPPMLEHLHVLQVRTITAKVRDHVKDYHSPSLYNFCSRAHRLKTISAPVFAPSDVTMDPDELPHGLVSFAAPLDTAQFVAAHRDVKSLGVLKCGLDTPKAIEALALIALARPALEVLVFEVKTWDAEIVAAISRHFKQLRRLKLVYGRGGPDENYIVNLGAELELPELHTLEMYKLPPKGGYTPEHPTHLFDNTWGSIEEEMRDLLIPWNHWCPKLHRVQLVSGYAMTRGFKGALWKMETVKRLKRIEYLDY